MYTVLAKPQADCEARKYTAQGPMNYLMKSLIVDKTMIMNYRKNREAFINLVTIIPVTGNET